MKSSIAKFMLFNLFHIKTWNKACVDMKLQTVKKEVHSLHFQYVFYPASELQVERKF